MVVKHTVKRRKPERRKSQRLDLPLKLACQWYGRRKPAVEAVTYNASGGGMKIRVDTPLRKGDILKGKLHFPESRTPIRAKSEVVWCKEKKVKGKVYYDAGIKHIEIVQGDRERFVFLFCETMLNHLLFPRKK